MGKVRSMYFEDNVVASGVLHCIHLTLSVFICIPALFFIYLRVCFAENCLNGNDLHNSEFKSDKSIQRISPSTFLFVGGSGNLVVNKGVKACIEPPKKDVISHNPPASNTEKK